jgi:hypothetical protein
MYWMTWGSASVSCKTAPTPIASGQPVLFTPSRLVTRYDAAAPHCCSAEQSLRQRQQAHLDLEAQDAVDGRLRSQRRRTRAPARFIRAGPTNGRQTHAQKPATVASASTAVSAKRSSRGICRSRGAVPAATIATARTKSAPIATSSSNPPSRPSPRSATMPIGTPVELRAKSSMSRGVAHRAELGASGCCGEPPCVARTTTIEADIVVSFLVRLKRTPRLPRA